MTPAPLLVIDGDSIGHRAYHAMPPLLDDDDRPAGLLLGFANVLLSTYDRVHPRAVLVRSTRASAATGTSCCRATRGSASRSHAT